MFFLLFLKFDVATFECYLHQTFVLNVDVLELFEPKYILNVFFGKNSNIYLGCFHLLLVLLFPSHPKRKGNALLSNYWYFS